MITSLVLALTVLPGSFHVHAAAGGDDAPNVYPFQPRRGAEATKVVNLLAGLERIHADLGSPRLPGYARAYVVRHGHRIENPVDWLEGYRVALEVAGRPVGEGGLGFAAEEAHAYAVELLARRRTADDVRFEISQYAQFLERLSSFKPSGEASRLAREAVVLVARGAANHVRAVERVMAEAVQKTYDGVIGEVEAAFARMGQDSLPTDAQKFVTELARQWTHSESMLKAHVSAYLRGLDFAHRPLAAQGLGLAPAEAHAHARDLLERRLVTSAIEAEIEAWQEVFAKLTAPAARRGYGLAPEVARAEALALVRVPVHPFGADLVERLELRRLVSVFLTTPIADGGLGLASEDVGAQLETWVARFAAQTPPIYFAEKFTNDYALAVASRRAAKGRGADDAGAIRDWALALAGEEDVLIESRLRQEGFAVIKPTGPAPLVTPRPDFVQHVRACVTALLPRRD